MIDKFLRKIRYLRISVTNMCNLRCQYCMPPEGIQLMEREEILKFEEIVTIVKHAVKLGIANLRLTGGDPLVRKNIERLVFMLASVEGVKDLAMTTNGILLKKYASTLKKNGLSRLNISLDTLREDRFSQITRGGCLTDVLEGIEETLRVGFQNTKINVVIMRGINDDELKDFVLFTSKYNVEVRFIELMSTGMKKMAEENTFITAEEIFQRIQDEVKLIPVNSNAGHGPARTYKIKDAKGVIGFISPVSKPFCGSCNRLRLTSDGVLRSCLLSGGEVDIKSVLRTNKGSQAIEGAFREAADLKPASHSGKGKFTMQHIGG